MGLKKQHINQNRFTFYTDWLGDGGVGRMRLNLFKEMLSCNLEIDLLVGRSDHRPLCTKSRSEGQNHPAGHHQRHHQFTEALPLSAQQSTIGIGFR